MNVDLLKYFNYNAYVTLTMFFISLITLIINYLTKGKANKYVFSTERASLLNPLTYLRLFTHILGHSDWSHFSNNYLKILLLGPLIEEKYGSIDFLIMILVTAFITGIVNYIKGDTRLNGASNITFMLIVLSAFVNISDNKIPLTLVLIIIFYITDELINTYKFQIDSMVTLNQRNAMEDIEFVRMVVSNHEIVNNIEKIEVIMEVTCKDYIVQMVDGKEK